MPADAEGVAPLHDLYRDLGQILLAEAGVPEIGVKVCYWQDHPLAIILSVGEVIADQRPGTLGLGRKNRDLILQHLASPRGGKF